MKIIMTTFQKGINLAEWWSYKTVSGVGKRQLGKAAAFHWEAKKQGRK